MKVLYPAYILVYGYKKLCKCASVFNKFPLVFRGMVSYFPRFSSSSRQNVVNSRGYNPRRGGFDGNLSVKFLSHQRAAICI